MAKAPQIGEDTKITLDFKTIGMIVGFVVTLSGMWYTSVSYTHLTLPTICSV